MGEGGPGSLPGNMEPGGSVKSVFDEEVSLFPIRPGVASAGTALPGGLTVGQLSGRLALLEFPP